jgi:hypothetical protein
MYGKWYAACFIANCRSPSVWSHYGDAHRGICLKFKTGLVNDLPSIKLHRIVGVKGSPGKFDFMYGDVDCQFYKVHYAKRYPEIDFFRSLGQVPTADINSSWYGDGNGNLSKCMPKGFTTTDDWHRGYWGKIYETITTKLEPWAYEDEYRLIMTELTIDYSPIGRRKAKYKFSDLEGIIFGMNTPEETKLSIFKVIQTKCRSEGRSNFKFYQAYYAKHAGDIEVAEMTFLKFT